MSFRDDVRSARRETGWFLTQMPLWAMLFLGGVLLLGGTGFVLKMFGNTARTAEKEFGAEALLRKYEWFKNTSAELTAKQASIQILQTQVEFLQEIPREKMDRQDKQELAQTRAELAGLKMSYNNLAGEYNSNMSKINWAFANTGKVPAGNEALPREFRVLVTE